MLLSLLELSKLVLQNSRQPSARSRHEILIAVGQILTPSPDFGELASFKNAWFSTFIHKINK